MRPSSPRCSPPKCWTFGHTVAWLPGPSCRCHSPLGDAPRPPRPTRRIARRRGVARAGNMPRPRQAPHLPRSRWPPLHPLVIGARGRAPQTSEALLARLAGKQGRVVRWEAVLGRAKDRITACPSQQSRVYAHEALRQVRLVQGHPCSSPFPLQGSLVTMMAPPRVRP